MSLRASTYIGFDYAHGFVARALQNSGTGYSPTSRRSFAEIATPWGPIDELETITEGIDLVSTASHGGYILSEKRQKDMPDHLTNHTAYYEEDCEGRFVELAFPDIFKEDIKYALASFSVGLYTSNSVPRERELGSDHEAFLSEVLTDYIPPEMDPMNRAITDDEESVVTYLSQCVLHNRQPISSPNTDDPTLQDWVTSLSSAPKVDGTWPFLGKPWRKHFSDFI
jgi:hypothetical protein